MGAEAYAMGNDVAFGGAPSLHTAAHEAAHVIQQQRGVQLKGGVGQTGDAYEQHADRAADAVVAGRSAEAILDAAPSGSSGGAAIQRKEADAPVDAAVAKAVDAPNSSDATPGKASEEDVARTLDGLGAEHRETVLKFAEKANKDLPEDRRVTPGNVRENMGGLCGPMTGRTMNQLDVAVPHSTDKSESLLGSPFRSEVKHRFAVAEMPDGDVYLVDTTYAQFRGHDVGKAFAAASPEAEAHLYERGWVKLTPEVAQSYGRALTQDPDATFSIKDYVDTKMLGKSVQGYRKGKLASDAKPLASPSADASKHPDSAASDEPAAKHTPAPGTDRPAPTVDPAPPKPAPVDDAAATKRAPDEVHPATPNAKPPAKPAATQDETAPVKPSATQDETAPVKPAATTDATPPVKPAATPDEKAPSKPAPASTPAPQTTTSTSDETPAKTATATPDETRKPAVSTTTPAPVGPSPDTTIAARPTVKPNPVPVVPATVDAPVAPKPVTQSADAAPTTTATSATSSPGDGGTASSKSSPDASAAPKTQKGFSPREPDSKPASKNSVEMDISNIDKGQLAINFKRQLCAVEKAFPILGAAGSGNGAGIYGTIGASASLGISGSVEKRPGEEAWKGALKSGLALSGTASAKVGAQVKEGPLNVEATVSADAALTANAEATAAISGHGSDWKFDGLTSGVDVTLTGSLGASATLRAAVGSFAVGSQHPLLGPYVLPIAKARYPVDPASKPTVELTPEARALPGKVEGALKSLGGTLEKAYEAGKKALDSGLGAVTGLNDKRAHEAAEIQAANTTNDNATGNWRSIKTAYGIYRVPLTQEELKQVNDLGVEYIAAFDNERENGSLTGPGVKKCEGIKGRLAELVKGAVGRARAKQDNANRAEMVDEDTRVAKSKLGADLHVLSRAHSNLGYQARMARERKVSEAEIHRNFDLANNAYMPLYRRAQTLVASTTEPLDAVRACNFAILDLTKTATDGAQKLRGL